MELAHEAERQHGNHHDQDYDAYLLRLKARFLVTSSEQKLFTTDADGLWGTYLDSFPVEDRQYHNCHACRQFIERFGSLVTIGDDGQLSSAIWSEEDAPEGCKPAIVAMSRLARRAKVTGIFLSPDKAWGTPITGIWKHLSVQPAPSVVHSRKDLTAYQVMAEKREDFKTVMHALNEFTQPMLEQAVSLLKSEAMYRSEKVLGAAEWLHSLHITRTGVSGTAKANLMWKAIAAAPAGFCHPRSSMIGTLLEDIAAGMDFTQVASRFAAKMHPLQYQRPQAAPSAGAIAQAEKLFESMGLASALRRRYARPDEVDALWLPSPAPEAESKGGVFGHLKAKDEPNTPSIEILAITMTWEKFQRTILPDAREIEFNCGKDNYTTILTATDPDAPPIIQWDRDEKRNPFSAYVWHGGSLPSQYGLAAGFQKIAAITTQPNMWGGADHAHQSKGVILILAGAKETRQAGLALFPEILRSELHTVRSVIEAHSRDGKIEGGEDGTATGVSLNKGGTWAALVRVTSKTGQVSRYKLDRWD